MNALLGFGLQNPARRRIGNPWRTLGYERDPDSSTSATIASRKGTGRPPAKRMIGCSTAPPDRWRLAPHDALGRIASSTVR